MAAPWPRRLALQTTRAAFRTLEHSVPPLGAAWAERLWFTLPKSPNRRSTSPPAGDRFEVQVYGRSVVGTAWGSGETIYLEHGWGGSAAQLAGFVAPLLDAGFRVVSHDAPSHGHSDPGPSGPRSSTVVEFADALRAVIDRYGPPVGVVAHSMGAMAAAIVIRGGTTMERAVFVAPMGDAASYTQSFTRMLGGGQRTAKRLARRIERRVGLALDDFDISGTPGVAATPELLVIHDEQDMETRLSGAEEIVEAWPDARLKTTTGLGHNRILRDPSVVAAAVGFLSAGTAAWEPRSNDSVAAGQRRPQP